VANWQIDLKLGCDMIDPNTIDECDECDGEAVHVFGRDTTTGQWVWQWVAIETLLDAGRADLLPWLFDAAA
jgi:hypothetical protein